jgi:hypothetical protein
VRITRTANLIDDPAEVTVVAEVRIATFNLENFDETAAGAGQPWTTESH